MDDSDDSMMLTLDNVTVVSAWAQAVIIEEVDPLDPDRRSPALNVLCRTHVKRASIGDRVIKHADGTFDVMGPLAYQLSLHQEG